MKILVTGSSGYIGSSVIERLGGRFSFVSFDIRENSKDDIRDLARLKRAVQGVDGVLHLAAISRPKWGFEDPYGCISTNVLGTLNVLEAVRRKNPRAWVILGSSREVFGNVKKFPGTEKTPRAPLNAYAVSKVMGEDMLRQYAANYGLSCLTIRFCGVYTGVRDVLDRVIPRFILRALRGAPLEVEGGDQAFDFVHIEDTVVGIRRAIQFVSKKHGSFYDDVTLARGKPATLNELAAVVIRLIGSKSRVVHVRARTYDQRGFWGSFSKAKKLFGWTPKISLEDGLVKSIKELKLLGTRRGYKK